MTLEKNCTAFKDITEQLEIYSMIFESLHDGAMVTDAEGYITHFNMNIKTFQSLGF